MGVQNCKAGNTDVQWGNAVPKQALKITIVISGYNQHYDALIQKCARNYHYPPMQLQLQTLVVNKRYIRSRSAHLSC